MKSFSQLNKKYKSLIGVVKKNRFDIKELNRQKLKESTSSFISKNKIISLDADFDYYGLYDFGGSVVAYGDSSPTPEDAYDEYEVSGSPYNKYVFKYPDIAFAVPEGNNPENYTDGASPWTKKETVGVIYNLYEFKNISIDLMQSINVLSYLYTPNNTTVPNLSVERELYGEDAVYTFHNVFWRWKQSDSLNTTSRTLEHFAIVPQISGNNIKLKTNIYFRSVNSYYVTNIKKI